MSFPGSSIGKDRPVLSPRVGKIPWRRKWQPTPVFQPGKFRGQRNLPGYSPWGCKELNKTEHRCTSVCDCLKNAHFSLTMSNLKRKFRRQVHLQWHKQIKVLRNKLNKGGRDLYIKNYKTLAKNSFKDVNKWKDTICTWHGKQYFQMTILQTIVQKQQIQQNLYLNLNDFLQKQKSLS